MKHDLLLNVAISAIGLAVGALGIGYGLGQRKKLSDISSRLDRSVKELSETMEENGFLETAIKDSIVEEAVKKAATRASERACKCAVEDIALELKLEMSSRIQKAIDASYSDINSSVKDELARKVKRLYVNTLKQEVIEDAKKEALEKLQTSMDDILEDFNSNLKNVTQIYQSMAEKLTGGSAKDLKISFS